MAPIRLGDGTEIDSVRLGDGTEVSEVRNRDGQTVFTAGIPVPNSGVARWTHDDADTSGSTVLDVWNNNDGTLNGGVTTGVSGANQEYNTAEAYEFDASDDFIDYGFQPFAGTSAFSAAIYFRQTNTGRAAVLSESRSQLDVWDLRPNVSQNEVQFFTDTGSRENLTKSHPLATGTWYHLVATYDGSEMALYIDGSLKGTKAQSGSLNDFGNPLIEGAFSPDGTFFGGRLDDVRLYDKALSNTEVSNLYNNGSING